MMVQKDLNGHLDRVNLLIQLTHGQGHLKSGPCQNFSLRIRGSPHWTILATFCCFGLAKYSHTPNRDPYYLLTFDLIAVRITPFY